MANDDGFIVLLALGTWRASGRRTVPRLRELIDHYAQAYAVSPDALYREAERQTYDWEIQT